MTRKRFRREDWLELGLKRLGEGGPEVLKIHDLCAAAERTIGSFYHHFKDMDVFFTELGKHWRKTHTQNVIEAVEVLRDPHDQAERLAAIASKLNMLSDLGMRRLGETRPGIQIWVAQVDAERVSYLQNIYIKRFDMSEGDAKTFAELEYAAFVGTQVIWRENARGVGERLAVTFDGLVRNQLSKSES
ncbi:MAG: TetR/AcrR family transcriptional regulator [Litoreibacter sp.]|uniref:TetR/AcrR family transcriptional regulator n=1 Tax=Litoreibacter sp. TaxID=1969459 RepID=UPI003297F7E1